MFRACETELEVSDQHCFSLKILVLLQRAINNTLYLVPDSKPTEVNGKISVDSSVLPFLLMLLKFLQFQRQGE